MNDRHALLSRGKLRLAAALAVAVAGSMAGCERTAPPPPTSPPLSTDELTKQVHQFCGACHAYPPADSFPRDAWREEVERGYFFFGKANLKLTPPPINQVVRYYEERAPKELPPLQVERASTPLPVRLERTPMGGTSAGPSHTISHINLVHLSDPKRLDLLATDMASGLVMALTPAAEKPSWRILGKVSNPAHAEVVDLDGDGIKDILVADLGSFPPTDRLCGSVVWLRGRPDGTFTPVTLLKGVGRVADVQAADFNGDGKLDLIVAVFGWQDAGEILLLENRTTDWNNPDFASRVLDRRHGAIHVPVADLNGDGQPDFIALIAQEHEVVVAFLTEGDGRFRTETLDEAPHPAYGSSGIQLVDVNGDGKLDVLYSNGDVLDAPHLLKPYHSVQWLENRTADWKKPGFVHHHIGGMYGVHRAVAADVDGDGDRDILAVSYLPPEHFPQRQALKVDSVVLFEQVAPGKFARHTLESITCDHVTCAVGDLYGTGRADLVTAVFRRGPTPETLTIWKNQGQAPR